MPEPSARAGAKRNATPTRAARPISPKPTVQCAPSTPGHLKTLDSRARQELHAPTMELSSSVPAEDFFFTERPSASAAAFNASFSEEPLLEASSSNGSSGAAAWSTAGVSIAVCITALYSLICVLGLLGNVLVMYGVVR